MIAQKIWAYISDAGLVAIGGYFTSGIVDPSAVTPETEGLPVWFQALMAVLSLGIFGFSKLYPIFKRKKNDQKGDLDNLRSSALSGLTPEDRTKKE